MSDFRVGEQLVWIHIDSKTGEKLQDLVVVRGVKTFTGKPYYQVQIVRTGDPAQAWSDELYRFEVK